MPHRRNPSSCPRYSNDPLIQQRCLDRGALALQRSTQHCGGESDHPAVPVPCRRATCGHPLRSPSAPDPPNRSVADRRSPRASRRPSPAPGARARRRHSVCRVGTSNSPRHPQMDQHRVAAADPHQDVFRPPAGDPSTVRAGQSLHGPSGNGQRRSGRLIIARTMRWPSSRTWRPRITVSTSGEFGHTASAHCDGRS